VDERNFKIISMLMKNARIPKTKIAEELEVTETAVRKRISKLEKDGIILGYKAVINYRTAGLSASLTGVDVEPDKLWEVINRLKDLDEIKSMFLTTGDHMIMLEIVAESVEELSKIHEKISELEGVKRICPAVILDVLK
jgi:Lrp/AsnC family transcriptional regulator for asnA, asnC and gidA